MTETRYQRIAREQAERQALRAHKLAAHERQERMEVRRHARWAREGRKERAYLDALVSDHNHDMDA